MFIGFGAKAGGNAENLKALCQKENIELFVSEAVEYITCKKMLEVGDKESLKRLQNELISKDYFMTFPDFADYTATKDRMLRDYEDRMAWARKMLINIANAGYFSSDRTINEYNKDIWKL